MANFKRGRCKNRRAGCLFCKPQKSNGNQDSFKYQRRQEQRARVSEREQINGR
jgi:hypothetical protein